MTPTTLSGGWWGTDDAIYDEEIGATVNEHGETWIEEDARQLPHRQPDRRATVRCWNNHHTLWPYVTGQKIRINRALLTEQQFRQRLVRGDFIDTRCPQCGTAPLIPYRLEVI